MRLSVKAIFDVLSEAETALKATPRQESLVHRSQRLHALRRVIGLRDQLREPAYSEAAGKQGWPPLPGALTYARLRDVEGGRSPLQLQLVPGTGHWTVELRGPGGYYELVQPPSSLFAACRAAHRHCDHLVQQQGWRLDEPDCDAASAGEMV